MNQTKPTLIFDMDGVILDTEQLVRRCWNEIAPEFHADAIDAVFLTTVGTTRVHTCSILRERYGADFPAEEFNNAVSRRYHVIDDAEGVPVKTGARELLQWARDNAYTIGLASSTRQAIVEKELSERGLLALLRLRPRRRSDCPQQASTGYLRNRLPRAARRSCRHLCH